MDIQAKKIKPKSFEPTTLELKFNTKEEWNTFRWMMSYNLTVPEAIYPDSEQRGSRKLLEDMMTKIHDVMRNEGYDYDL